MPSLDRRFVVLACCVAVLTATIGLAATTDAPVPVVPDAGGDTAADAPAPTDAVARLHGAGYTGENVTVGVLDVTGFDTGHPALAGRVAGTRAFADGETIANGGRTDHGTAVASVVARTAPAADLYLASFDTDDGFQQGVAWLLGRDVDVVVAPVSFPGAPGDGTSAVARAVQRAARQGVIVVAPTGNVGQNHWEGRFDPVDAGTHLFERGTRNYLLPGERTDERIRLWLSWDATSERRDFTLALYAVEGGERRLLARSQPYPADSAPNERLVATLEANTTYYVVLRGPPDAAGARVAVTSPTHRLSIGTRADSLVAPASARPVLAVGSYDREGGYVDPFSAAGPVADGRSGVDLVAPDGYAVAGRDAAFDGTSASAAYVAGVAALVVDAAPARSAAEVRRSLAVTTTDTGPPGVDPTGGHGRVRPVAAVRAARNAT
ncbi:S8 family serine peptidase [Salinirubrum litoreum]|uniref:S8 family serine peptidase n=1 Tax=Salinirubrum litoreum TaxID=1126234 RepID=A0ABD5RCR4_9EURY|nr:S8 family serine peptidase [Salinirubrum litoreum]